MPPIWSYVRGSKPACPSITPQDKCAGAEGFLSQIERDMHSTQETVLEDGSRIGRYVLLRDTDGCLHALSATAVGAVCECDDGCLLLLPGGRLLRTTHALARVLAWLT